LQDHFLELSQSAQIDYRRRVCLVVNCLCCG
jgi:hypothetical protein